MKLSSGAAPDLRITLLAESFVFALVSKDSNTVLAFSTGSRYPIQAVYVVFLCNNNNNNIMQWKC